MNFRGQYVAHYYVNNKLTIDKPLCIENKKHNKDDVWNAFSY